MLLVLYVCVCCVHMFTVVLAWFFCVLCRCYVFVFFWCCAVSAQLACARKAKLYARFCRVSGILCNCSAQRVPLGKWSRGATTQPKTVCSFRQQSVASSRIMDYGEKDAASKLLRFGMLALWALLAVAPTFELTIV